MAKTYMEMSNEIVTAMINRGLIVVQNDKGADWKSRNKLAVKTVGWALLEMYMELKELPERAPGEIRKRKEEKNKRQGGIILRGR